MFYFNSEECETEDELPKCLEKGVEKARVLNHCEYLKPGNRNSPFHECMTKIPMKAKQYLESCEMDACAYANNITKLEQVVCLNTESFAEECHVTGYKAKWRTPDFCRKY